MDTPQNTALTRALTELPGPLPARGVIHIAIRHTDRFTVVGNDLAQHPGLSTAAVGFAVRIQSLPQGTEVGIKALAGPLPGGREAHRRRPAGAGGAWLPATGPYTAAERPDRDPYGVLQPADGAATAPSCGGPAPTAARRKADHHTRSGIGADRQA
ncbi:hypothetical protein SMICM304S_01974 [Streptomyces microflavus]